MQFNRSPSNVNATVSGGVAVTNTPGVISKDSFTNLNDPNIGDTWALPGSGPVYDVSAFQCVVIDITLVGDNADFPITVDWTALWTSSASVIPINSDAFTTTIALGDQESQQQGYRIILPCRGARLQIQSTQAGVPLDLAAQAWVYGSYRTLTPRFERIGRGAWGTSGTGNVQGSGTSNWVRWSTGNLAASSSFTEQPPFKAGPASLLIDVSAVSGAASQMVLQVADGATNNWYDIAGLRNVAAVTKSVQNVILPRRPLRFFAFVPAACTATAFFDLSSQDQ